MTQGILVVEDDKIARDIFCAWFLASGYEVYAAMSAFEASLILDDVLSFDLLLTDVDVPRTRAMNGFDIAMMLRSRHSELPIILVSGHANLSEKTTDITAPLEIVEKPVSKRVLLSAVEKLLTG